MAKTSMKVKQKRPAKYSTRQYNRCKICGRPTRVGHVIVEEKGGQKKMRVCKKADCGAKFE